MDTQVWLALASSLLGGGAVAVITQLSTRNRTQAEVRKMDAEAERTRAETAKLLSELKTGPVQESPSDGAPFGWELTGSDPDHYQVGTDVDIAHSGARSGFIASRPEAQGFGTLMQQFKAERFRGKRLRMSGYVRTDGVKRWAGLWMRVDGPDDETLAFDNMQDRPISGTADWRLHRIVLDIPAAAEVISFGVLLEGQGCVWLDDVEFETVSDDIPTTGVRSHGIPERPANLDFSASFGS